MKEFGMTAPVLSKRMCETAYERLVATPEEQKSELIDLNHAPSLKNLPPAYVVTAEYDPLRDEGEYYAARLFKNNVPVSCITAPWIATSEVLSLAETPVIIVILVCPCKGPSLDVMACFRPYSAATRLLIDMHLCMLPYFTRNMT